MAFGDIIKKLVGTCSVCGSNVYLISKEGYRCVGKLHYDCDHHIGFIPKK